MKVVALMVSLQPVGFIFLVQLPVVRSAFASPGVSPCSLHSMPSETNVVRSSRPQLPCAAPASGVVPRASGIAAAMRTAGDADRAADEDAARDATPPRSSATAWVRPAGRGHWELRVWGTAFWGLAQRQEGEESHAHVGVDDRAAALADGKRPQLALVMEPAPCVVASLARSRSRQVVPLLGRSSGICQARRELAFGILVATMRLTRLYGRMRWTLVWRSRPRERRM